MVSKTSQVCLLWTLTRHKSYETLSQSTDPDKRTSRVAPEDFAGISKITSLASVLDRFITPDLAALLF